MNFSDLKDFLLNKMSMNLLVIQDSEMAARYAENWKAHREHSEPYTGLPASHGSQSHREKVQ